MDRCTFVHFLCTLFVTLFVKVQDRWQIFFLTSNWRGRRKQAVEGKPGTSLLPGSPVVKSLSVNGRDTGLIPGLGRLHMPRGSSVCVLQLLKLVCPTAHVLQQKPPQWKTHALQLLLQSSSCLPQLEKAWAHQWKSSAAKKKKKKNLQIKRCHQFKCMD